MMRRDVAAGLKGWGLDLGLATACGVFWGAIGPFGSFFNGALWERAAFQVFCFWTGVLLFGTAIRLVLALGRPPRATWMLIALALVVLCLPLALIAALAGRAVWPFLVKLTAWDWYSQALLSGMPVGLALAALIERRRRGAQAQAARRDWAPASGVLGAPAAEILYLRMEDHYVRVHTRAGSRLVLASMAQAMKALEGVEGLQTHRSWWVARRAVSGVEAAGRNLRLRLCTGEHAPVARSAVAAVRAAGWLEAEPAPPAATPYFERSGISDR